MDPCASGISAQSVWRELRRLAGDKAYLEAVGQLDVSERTELQEATAVSWVRMSTTWALVQAIAEQTGHNADALYDEAVRKSVDSNIATAWRAFLNITSDEAVIARTPIVYAKTRNIGRMASRLSDKKTMTATVTEWPHMSDLHIRVLAVGMQRLLEVAGRAIIENSWSKTDDGALLMFRWS